MTRTRGHLFFPIIILPFFLFASNEVHYVAINFDDGYYAVYKYAYPILSQAGIPFTLGVITKTLSFSRKNISPYSYLTISEIKEMVSSGCEIASHSQSHRDLTKLDSLSLWEELSSSKKILESLFSQEIKSFIYPYGRYDSEVLRLLPYAGYSLGRSVGWGEVNFFSPYRLPAREVRKGTKVEKVLDYLNKNRFSILLFHRILPEPKYFTDYSLKDFQILISYLKLRNDIKFLTLSEMTRKWWEERLKEILFLADQKKREELFKRVEMKSDVLRAARR